MTQPVGHQLVVTRTFTQGDFDTFARLSGDDNPIHVDPEFAARTRFGRTLAHGMMLFSTISGLIRGAYDAELEDIELMFPGPTYVGDAMTLQLTVVSRDGARAEIAAHIHGPDCTPACVATARIISRDT